MTNDQVLIVEDNQLQGQAFEKLAIKSGVQPHLVRDGREAIEAVMRNPYYAVIFMDLGLIKMDGLECTRRIRDIELVTFKRLPIIAITARSGEEARQECLDAGMDDYLCKPFTLEQFQEMLTKWRFAVDTQTC